MLLLIEARCLCSKMSGSIWRKGSAPSVFTSYRDCSHSKTLPPGTLMFPLSFGIVGCHLYFTTWMEICFRISIPRSNVLAVSVRIKAFSKNQGLSQSYQKCTAAHHNHKHSANCTVHSATVQIAQCILEQYYSANCTADHPNHKHSANCTVHSARVQIARCTLEQYYSANCTIDSAQCTVCTCTVLEWTVKIAVQFAL